MLKKITAIILAVTIMLLIPVYTFAATKSELQQQKEEAQKEQQEVKEEKSETMEEVEKLLASIADNEDKLEDINTQLVKLNKEITETKKELEETQEKYIEQEEFLKEKLIIQYESGKTTYLDVLLNSKGILEFISNYYLLSEVLQNDNDLLNSIEEQKNKIEKSKKQLEEKQKEVKTQKAEQEKINVVLSNQKTQKENKVAQLSKEEKELAEEISQINKEIRKIEEEARRASQSSGGGKVFDGVLTWPCPNYSRISSYFGYRSSPGGGVGSTNHKGLDLAAPHGVNIVAAGAGKVIKVIRACSHDYPKTTSTRCSCGGGYGNYLMIDHQNGLVSIYAHCSTIDVSLGQSVSAGQKIATVGSTGYSTGNHLHFGVWANGVVTDPLNYYNR